MATLQTCPPDLADAAFEKLAAAVRYAREDNTRRIYRRVKLTCLFGAFFATSLAYYFFSGALQ